MESLFDAPKAKRRVLPPAIRRAIVDLKAEHPPLNLEEIANICGTLFGRRPDGQTVKAVLEESAIPRKLVRRFEPYHEIPDDRERREAVVALHLEGWADKSIARYLRVDRSTVYRVRRRFEEEGEEGLWDRPAGRPRGVAKVDPSPVAYRGLRYGVVSSRRVFVTVDVLPAASVALKVKTHIPSRLAPQSLVPVEQGSDPVSVGIVPPNGVKVKVHCQLTGSFVASV
jgi:hypothetical protein